LINDFIIDAINRHYRETKPLFEQLTDEALVAEPVQTGRSLGEIVLHMIRAMEYYLQGLVKGLWEPLPYNMDKYNSKNSILKLYEEVEKRCIKYLGVLKKDDLMEEINYSGKKLAKIFVLQDFLEHNIGHRGQILVYLRLLDIEPEKIPFKI
jgi:uncharacterized damage-inducible protein DinB